MKTIVLLISYILRVNAADLSRYDVEMRIQGAPDTFTLAMMHHPEYDDRFYRYVENLTISSGTIVRADSQLWRVTLPGGDGVVHYSIHLPAERRPRASWRPFLSPTGGLVGGPHSFMYILGQEGARSTVTLDLPAGWQTASTLPANPNVDELIESPILIGHLHTWTFGVGGLPHHVVYLGTTPFDTTAYVGAVERIAQQAYAIFGRAPYREFTFFIQDSAWGGLEHFASVTLGIPDEDLVQVAHEYFHTWNEVSIRPIEWGGVTHLAPTPSGGLWFTEGVTMFYADLLLRRAGITPPDTTRLAHLQRYIGYYLSNPANYRLSAEEISRTTDSPHLPGELIGVVLDLAIRDATDGRRSLDDVMRLMNDRFGDARPGFRGHGFTGPDIERAAHDACRCDVAPIFERSVRNAGAIDFARYLALAGLAMDTTHAAATRRDGTPFERYAVRISERQDATPKQRRIREQWMAGR